MIERFKELDVRTRRKVEVTATCWLWTGYTERGGYAQAGHKMMHRAIYQKLVGPIPEGFELDHLCNVTRCVNPAHVEPVTSEEHYRRTAERRLAAVTHCPQGHPYDEANTYWHRNGRHCR